MSSVVLDCGICFLREWREEDVEQLVAIANDADVLRYLSERFPHPYTLDDARWWTKTGSRMAGLHLAIVAGDRVAGGIGYDPLPGERRFSAHLGYWLGRTYWGRGIASAACAAVTEYVFAHTDVVRVETTVYAPNRASMRVLEKCGYEREGVMRKAVVKNGTYLDAVMYARLRERNDE